MSRPFALRPLPYYAARHSLHFLAYLEWGIVLVGLAAIALPMPLDARTARPLAIAVCLLGFAALGWVRPGGRMAGWLWAIAQVAIVTLASAAGARLFSLLFVAAIARSCFVLPRRHPWGFAAIATVAFLAVQTWRLRHLSLAIALPAGVRLWLMGLVGGLFCLAAAFVVLAIAATEAERRVRSRLAEANARLRRYALQVEANATLAERNRLAREIHDGLGHALVGLNLQLETALALGDRDPEAARSFLLRAKQQGSAALESVRASVAALRVDPLAERPLSAAIAALVRDFEATTGIAPALTAIAADGWSREVALASYRIVQEALTNICKHARATEVSVTVAAEAEGARVAVCDNGIGFAATDNATGFGLQGMRERALALDGSLQIQSAPGRGCVVVARLPWRSFGPEPARSPSPNSPFFEPGFSEPDFSEADFSKPQFSEPPSAQPEPEP